MGYTHLFTANLVNQINPGASWYASIFEPDNFASVQQQLPIVLAAGSSTLPFTTIGGNDQTYPQGRKVTQWQVNDNLIWTLYRHTLKFGVNTRRVDVSNYDLGQGTVPLVTVTFLVHVRAIVLGMVIEEAHHRTVGNKGDNAISLVINELQAADPYQHDDQGSTQHLHPHSVQP